MSGHNKWSKIKHKKAATDAKKSKIFSKYAKLITVESKLVDGNIDSPALKSAIDQAKAVNMPADNIARAVKKGTSADAVSMEAITYEAYGPGGCAFIIEALTDSKNRAAAEVRHILSKNGGFELGAMGSATWAFSREARKWVPQSTIELSDEDMEKAAKLIDLLEESDDIQEVFTNISEE